MRKPMRKAGEKCASRRERPEKDAQANKKDRVRSACGIIISVAKIENSSPKFSYLARKSHAKDTIFCDVPRNLINFSVQSVYLRHIHGYE
jgi:hypothetical protein